jgi:outer membrane protein assembly factor BamB
MVSVLIALLAAAPASLTPGLRVSWQAPLNAGSGALRIDRAGDLWVVQAQGGESVSLSAATGARRATLVGPSGPIDRYSQSARLLRGVLLGPDTLHLAAVDVRTGKVRWKRPVGGLDPLLDEHSLRDGLSVVEAGSLDVIAFRHTQPRGGPDDGPRWRFTLAGIDAASGQEVWRRSVLPADGVKPAWDDTVTLFVEGKRVLALAPGRLEALDARTGAPVWSHALQGSPRPMLAWAPGRVALHEHGTAMTHILEAATGRELASFPQSGGTVEALSWLSGGLCAVSSHDEGGEAACVAVEDGNVRELWRKSFALGPTQVLWDARRLLVTLGAERLLALDGRSGNPLWEVTLSHEVRFWIAPDERGEGQLFTFDSGHLLALEREEKPAASLPPYLRYVLAEEPGGTCQTKAVEWVDGDGKVLWSRPPPVSPGRALSCATGELRNYRHAPRYRKLPGYWNLKVEGAVWIFTGAGLQGIDVKKGELYEGTFAYGNCRGPAPGGLVYTVCGQEFVVFNGLTALVVDLPARAEKARGQFSQRHHRSGGRAAQVSARIPVGKRTLELVGLIYMR